MKTAVSIPDAIFKEAERLAKQRGWSRSQLYANAVAEYVEAQRHAGVRERLDAVYKGREEESALDPVLEKIQALSLPKEEW
jgi:predicted transcriptional regulator